MNVNERRRELALEALVTEPDVRKAAKIAKVSEATIYRWLNEPGFSARYKELRKRAFDKVLQRLQATAMQAVETLRDVSADSEAPASSRVAAAKTILEMAFRGREQEEFETRLAALEDKLKEGIGA